MHFADAQNPTEPELSAWASDAGAAAPMEDWELVLSWGMERGRLRTVSVLAADSSSPNAGFFLRVLYEWVAYVSRQDDFETQRPTYDRWLDQVKGVRDAAVKRWRRQARLIFQGQKPFDPELWWSTLRNDGNPN